MNNALLMKRIKAVEMTAETLLDNEPIRTSVIDCGLTLEESKMLDAYHGKPERGGRITEIRRVFVSTNDRPARPLAELVRVWDEAILEAEHERT